MQKRITIHKISRVIYLLKILSLIFLLALPMQADADLRTTGTPINAQTTDPNYWPSVIAELEGAHTQAPDDEKIATSLANAYNNYGALLAQGKQWQEAENYLNKALEINPSSAIKTNLSNVYFAQAQDLYLSHNPQVDQVSMHNNVKQLANKALELDPNNGNAYLLLGDVADMEQQMPEAQANWQRAAALMPNNPNVQNRMREITNETSVEGDMTTVYNPFFLIKVDNAVAQNSNFNIDRIVQYAHDADAPDYEFLQDDRVPVVVYNKYGSQGVLANVPSWVEAAYDGKIRLRVAPDQTDFHQITSDVVHEYTHAIVAAYAGNNCPRWFNEGLAKYQEFKHGIPPRLFELATAYNSDALIPWDQANTKIIGEDKNVVLLAYQQSFSFIYYIVERYGMQKIITTLKALGANNGKATDFPTVIQNIYGESIDTMQKNWRIWLTDFITRWAEQPLTEGSEIL